jgi:hypothetical protein
LAGESACPAWQHSRNQKEVAFLLKKGNAMNDFTAKYGDQLTGVSKRMKEASLAPLMAAGREVRYLNSGKDNKQQIALEIAARDGIVEGPICALTAVERCSSYAIKINPRTQRPELAITPRKCLFLYHYWIHPVLGFMGIRLQSWFPFTVHIYLNGREWLARQMDRAGIGYRRHDNCFTWVEQVSQAQKLLDAQLKTNWVQLFDPLVQQVHPLLFSELCNQISDALFLDLSGQRMGHRFPVSRWCSTASFGPAAVASGGGELLPSRCSAFHG